MSLSSSPAPANSIETEIEDSIQYLNSAAAIKSLEADAYWPKWNSTWWHMLLLHEMGQTHKIPAAVVEKYAERLNQMPLKIFPIEANEMPPDVDPYRGSPCHCQLGNAYQVMAHWGLDVDKKVPWIRPWFIKYQMADGGLNCDNEAYLVKDETPSSMVGTIAAFEAILLYTPRPWTPDELKFLKNGAQFLMNRKLMLGSDTKHNASERKSAERWTELCFPRFYLYDVLRGLNALLLWSEKSGEKIPQQAIEEVVRVLKAKLEQGPLKVERHSYENAGTIYQNEIGEWVKRRPAFMFPLLEKVSEIGSTSPYLNKQWENVQRMLEKFN